MSRWKKVGIAVSLPLLLMWLCTGGVVTVRYQRFLPGFYNREYCPLILLTFQQPSHTEGIPFLYTYSSDGLPFDMDLTYITHNLTEPVELTITNAKIRYSDGTTDNLPTQQLDPFQLSRDEHWYLHTDGTMIKKKSLQTTVSFKKCIRKRQSFSLQLSTQLNFGKQLLEQVDTTIECSSFSETNTMTMWFWRLL